jgi:pimeloyl-ACP methyl ester carboxylesterase
MKDRGCIFLIIGLFFLSTSQLRMNAQIIVSPKRIEIISPTVVKAGQVFNITCLEYDDLSLTPQAIQNPEISYRILDPIYFPNYKIISKNASINYTVNELVDIEIKIQLICKYGGREGHKEITVLPKKTNTDPDKYAMLFVHGLAGDHTTWDILTNHLEQKDKRFYLAGNLDFRPLQSQVLNFKEIPGKIPMFTMDFSDNQNLSFNQQGDEVNIAINKILNQIGDRKIILVGHSMGGLAARAYLYKFGADKIAGLITAVSPHHGSTMVDLPEKCFNTVKEKHLWDEHLKKYFSNLDRGALALQYLKPGSNELNILNSNKPLSIPIVLCNSIKSNITSYRNLGSVLFCITDMYKVLFEIPVLIPNVKNFDLLWNSYTIKWDGIVPFSSQFINKEIQSQREYNPKVFVTNKFHTNVHKDTRYMTLALDALFASIAEKKSGNVKKKILGLIMDSSGSMAENDPNNIRISAFKQVLKRLSGQEDVFIVDFDDQAKWLNTDNWQNWDVQSLSDELNKIDASGGTDIGAGLTTMRNILDGKWNNQSSGGVLLFTDGKGDYNNEVNWFKHQGIPVYTISYKDKADAYLLNNIALSTGGIYIQANNDQDVIMGLNNFFNQISGYDNLFSASYNLYSDEIVNYEFYVDPGTKLCELTTTWNGKDQVNISLISPSAVVYKENVKGNWIQGVNSKTLRIDNPLKGKWKLTFENNSTTSNDIYFSTILSADTKYNFKMNQVLDKSKTPTFKITGSSKDIDLKQHWYDIWLETPSGNVVDQSGIYHNGLIRIIPAEGPGNYLARISFKAKDSKNNDINRSFERSVFFGEQSVSFISNVSDVIGNIAYAPLGKWVGNQPGIECFIYNKNGLLKAKGSVTYVEDNECEIKIEEFLNGFYEIVVGDTIELDQKQWQND